METTNQSGVKVKIFIGCALTPEVRNQLSQNPEWQEKESLIGASPSSIRKIKQDNAEYVGCFLEPSHPTMQLVQETKARILDELEDLCPDLTSKAFDFFCFPTNVFIVGDHGFYSWNELPPQKRDLQFFLYPLPAGKLDV